MQLTNIAVVRIIPYKELCAVWYIALDDCLVHCVQQGGTLTLDTGLYFFALFSFTKCNHARPLCAVRCIVTIISCL